MDERQKREKALDFLRSGKREEFNEWIFTIREEERDNFHLNLCDADLSEVDLTLVDLSFVNLSGSVFGDDADIRTTKFKGANLRGIHLRDRNLMNVSFKGANLSGVDFSFAFLMHADLRQTNLTCTNLKWASLLWADLTDCQHLDRAEIAGANFFACKGLSKEDRNRISKMLVESFRD